MNEISNVSNEDSLRRIGKAYDLTVGQAEGMSRRGAAARPEGVGKDEITLSDAGKELRNLLKAAHAAPDIRAEKVADLKRRIESGSYQVTDDVLIDSILGRGVL